LRFRDPELSLRDILEGIDMIVEFVREMGLEGFRQDPKTIAAVERKLLLISEAPIQRDVRFRWMWTVWSADRLTSI